MVARKIEPSMQNRDLSVAGLAGLRVSLSERFSSSFSTANPSSLLCCLVHPLPENRHLLRAFNLFKGVFYATNSLREDERRSGRLLHTIVVEVDGVVDPEKFFADPYALSRWPASKRGAEHQRVCT